jgi:hypothetical protein
VVVGAQGHTASEWEGQDSNPGGWLPSPTLLITLSASHRGFEEMSWEISSTGQDKASPRYTLVIAMIFRTSVHFTISLHFWLFPATFCHLSFFLLFPRSKIGY